jgi:hypothetical protein
MTLSGGLQKLADFAFTVEPRPQAGQFEFIAEFEAAGLSLRNSWLLWLYPRHSFVRIPKLRLNNRALETFLRADAPTEMQDTVLTDCLDDALFADLEAGRHVILLYHRDAPWRQYLLPGALDRYKPCIWDRGSHLGGIVADGRFQKAMGSGRYFNLNWQGLVEGGYKVCLDHFPCAVEECISGVDKPVRDRMKGIVNGIKDFIDDDTLRNFSYLFQVKCGNGALTVCTFAMTRLANPAVAAFVRELVESPQWPATTKTMQLIDFKEFVKKETAQGPRPEDVMNHFWELDNKLVEDTLFWEETGLDLSKIR